MKMCHLEFLDTYLTLNVFFSRKAIRSTFHANLSILACFDFGYTFVSTFESVLKLVDAEKRVVHGASCMGEDKEPNKSKAQ